MPNSTAEKGRRRLIVLSIDPQEPTRLARVHDLKLAGPALDLALSADGAVVYVAAGGAGLVAVDLLPEPAARPAVALAGFASGVAIDGERVYVAACSNLSIVDAPTGQLLGSVDLQSAEGQAPRPVKDVIAQGNYAFAAAGRWGALVVDVSDPRQPRALGNRTVSDDLLYYANGLALSHGNLYIAAGDWGVDRMKVEDFATLDGLAMTPPQAFARYCTPSEDPARQPAPEFQTTLPPPRVQDPLDVVPVGDTLLAMGDASRLGVRAVDVYRLAEDGAHGLAGRYEEPALVSSIAAGPAGVALAGKLSGLFSPVEGGPLLARASALPESEAPARVVALADDGRLVALDTQGQLTVDGQLQPARTRWCPRSR